jgi:quinol-cytochrome oxidoreductase complex cytochrome b subunit
VGTAIVETVPLVGEELKRLARGGDQVTGDTLARFYALHVVVFPLVGFALLGIHLFLVQKHGMSVPDGEALRHGGADRVPSMPFVPHFLVRDMVGWYLALGILAALAALFPWELGEKADPFGATPEGIQPEWYFLFMFQTLKILPSNILGIEGQVVGVMFFGLCGLVVLVVPFLDCGQRSRRTLNVLAAAAVAFFIGMTAWGWFPHQPRLATILGAGLSAGVLLTLLPLLERGGKPYRAVMILAAVAGLVLVAATAWELLA